MKKRIVIISLVSILIFMSAVLSGCYGKSMEELTGHDSYVSAEYGALADNPWKPVGKRDELLGTLENGKPVYGYEGDNNYFYIYVGKSGSREAQTGMLCRSDVNYPDVTKETVDGIQFVSFESDNNSKTYIRDKEYIEKVFEILDAKENEEYLEISSVEADDFAKRVGVINFISDSLPGLEVTMGIVLYKGDYYYVIDNSDETNWLCVEDEGTVAFPGKAAKL